MLKNINEAKSIEEIAEIEKNYNLAAKNAGWGGAKSVLKDMYKDPSHFVFELLQNAEDTNAEIVRMVLTKDAFIFMHNGYKFSLDDIKGICKAGDSNKTSDKKGKFGIGFKAVYKITNTPYIYSEDYNFAIEEYNVPTRINGDIENELGTKIELPFNSELQKENVYQIVKNGMTTLDEGSIMFLDHIKEINLVIDDVETKILKSTSLCREEINDISYKEMKFIIGENESIFQLYQKQILIEGNQKNISIAFHIINDDEMPIKTNKLSVYFPTEQETALRFKLDAPFETTPTREQVDLTTHFNQIVLRNAVELYRDVIFCMKNNDVLSLDMLYQLAINSENENNEFYGVFLNTTIDIFNNNELLPSLNGKYIKASEALLCRDNKLFIELLSTDDLKTLFNERTKWIDDSNLKSIRTDEVRSFLTKSLKVVDFEFNTFNARVTESFFDNKDDLWLMRFYTICMNNIANIRNSPKPIIRTSDSKMKSPYKGYRINAKPSVYLPSKYINQSAEVIKNSFLEDESSMDFFRALNIEEADLLEAIKLEWIPFLKSSLESTSDVCEIFIEILNMIFTTNHEKKSNILYELSELRFIPVVNSNGDKLEFEKSINVYMNNPYLKSMLSGSNARFLCEEIQSLFDSNNKYTEMLRQLGINQGIKVLEDNIKGKYRLPEEVKRKVKNSYPNFQISERKNHSVPDYEIEYFETILDNLSEINSQYLWKYIVQLDPEWFYPEYQVYFLYEPDIAKGRFLSTLCRRLMTEKWIYSDNQYVSPFEITFEDFSKNYFFHNEEIEQHLSFKTLEDFSSLSDDTREKVEITNAFSVEDVKTAINLLKDRKRQEKIKSISDNYLTNIFVNVLMINLNDIEIEELSGIKSINFNKIRNLDLIYKILLNSNTLIEQFNEVSDLKFDKIMYFEFKLKQLLSVNEDKWTSTLFQRMLNEDMISRKQKFTEEITKYQQYDFSLSLITDKIEIGFDWIQYYNNIEFLQFEKHIEIVELSKIYAENKEVFLKSIKAENLSLEKIETFLNYPQNRSLLFLGEYKYLLKRYKTIMNGKDQKEISDLPEDITIEFNVSSTKGIKVLHKKVSATGSELDIKKSANSKSITGLKAEKIVYKYLSEDRSRVTDVKWKSENADPKVNPNGKAGLGYDIQYSIEQNTYFVEVKGTRSKHNKLQLFFSRREIQFAQKSADSYQIFVVLSTDSKSPKIYQIDNLFSNNDFNLKVKGETFVAEPSGFTVYIEIIE